MKLARRLGMAAMLVAVGLSLGSAASAEGHSSTCGCGPNVVAERGALVVLPTGHDDTGNLQCAIDRAGRLRIRKVRLVEGTYYTGQLVANNFVGHLAGASTESTVVRNLGEPLYVTPENPLFEAPSADNPWPSLLAFVDGRFRVSDLTIRIVGTPTSGWSIFGIQPPIKAMAHGIVILGTRAEATIENVAIEGEELPNDLFGLSVINGVYFEGAIGEYPPPLAGSLTVRHCVFRRVASGAPVVNLTDADVRIIDNHFEDVLLGSEVTDLSGTRYAFLGNHVSAGWFGLDQYDVCLGPVCGVSSSTLTVAGNHFEKAGVRLEGTLGSRVRCALVANDFAPDVSPDVFLGPDTHDCLVVGTPDVEDHGTHNRIIP
jgi:hypothetical protein